MMTCSSCRYYSEGLCFVENARKPTPRDPGYLCPLFKIFLDGQWYKSKADILTKIREILSSWEYQLNDEGELVSIQLFHPK